MSIEECSTNTQGWDELNPAQSWKGRLIEPLEAKSLLRSHSKLDFIPEAYQCGGTRPKGMTVTSYTLEDPGSLWQATLWSTPGTLSAH